jgi:hypothetical protein
VAGVLDTTRLTATVTTTVAATLATAPALPVDDLLNDTPIAGIVRAIAHADPPPPIQAPSLDDIIDIVETAPITDVIPAPGSGPAGGEEAGTVPAVTVVGTELLHPRHAQTAGTAGLADPATAARAATPGGDDPPHNSPPGHNPPGHNPPVRTPGGASAAPGAAGGGALNGLAAGVPWQPGLAVARAGLPADSIAEGHSRAPAPLPG